MPRADYITDTLRAGLEPVRERITGDTTAYAADSVGYRMQADSLGLPGYSADPVPSDAELAAEIFGGGSYRMADSLPEAAEKLSFTDGLLYQVCVVLLLILYLYMIFAYRDEIGMLMRQMFGRKSEWRSRDDCQGTLGGLVNAMIVCFLLAIGLVVMKLSDLPAMTGAAASIPEHMPGIIVDYYPVLAALAVMLVLALTGLIQYVVVKLAGSLTLSDVFAGKLIWMKQMFIAALAIVAVPAVISMALAPPGWDIIFGYISAGIAVLFALWFAFSTMILFAGQKVSILFWFLYLCAVELMPIGIVVLAVIRAAAN